MKKRTMYSICSLAVMCAFLLLIISCKKDEKKDDPTPAATVTDIDGNVYHKVTIGTQIWMVENLKTTKYNDGTAIPLVTGVWSAVSTPAYCWYDNDEAKYKNIYGALYNWYVVNTGKLCPPGWHVPTDAEYTTLTTYLGGESVAGGKLKEAGTTHWQSPNDGATNSSGFTALPAGYRYNAMFTCIGEYGIYWSSTGDISNGAWVRNIGFDRINVTRYEGYVGVGWPVRCVKD